MTLALLLELTLRGSLVSLAAALADRFLASSTKSSWRRVWWLLVPLAFLAPCEFPHPVFPYGIGFNGATNPGATSDTAVHYEIDLYKGLQLSAAPFATHGFNWLVLLWLIGAIVTALRILIATWRVRQQWSRERFCTDAALLNLLEDAKACAGIHAPIGLVVSDRIKAPALLGWLRPRILLPSHLAGSCATELEAVLLHELAHFRSLDIPLNWLFALVRVVHWFNPLAWLASAAWSLFVEEAADESAIRWTHAPTGTAYGEILLKTLGRCPGGPAPYGALAIGESIATLKRRILMIRQYPSKSNRGFLATAVVFILAALLAFSPALIADEDQDAAKKDALAAMDGWLKKSDSGDYAGTWNDAAKSFQKAISAEKWIAINKGIRAPLGKLLTRRLDSAAYSSRPPLSGSDAATIWVIAQYDTSFENMKYARETVTFEKEADGTWRAAGYYIKPQ
jgi:beta-lactamase regulating signal transducer with metallopeptidase domain